MTRYNFDRIKNGRKMAAGIAVHAESIDEAVRMAGTISDDDAKLVFRDNEPCPPGIGCQDCRKEKYGKLHSDNLDLKKKVARLDQTIRDLQTDNGRLLTDQIVRESKIAELEQEQGEIVGYTSVYKCGTSYSIGGLHKTRNMAYGYGKDFASTVPIRLPKKEKPNPEPVPFSRDDFVAMTPEQLEFARELTEPEEGIPESVKAHLELLRKQAGWQVPTTVAEHEVANWLLANLRPEAVPKKPKKIRTYAGNLYYDTPSDCMVILDCKVNTCPPYFRFIREISGEEEV